MTHAVYNPSTWLDQFFSDLDRSTVGARGAFQPNVDIVEEKDAFILRAELPGIAKENIKVEVKENRLILSGHKENRWEKQEVKISHSESAYGGFSRSFELPRNVNHDSVKAEYQNGVLFLRIPKSEEALSRTIEIH